MPQSPAITSSSHTNGAGNNRYPFASDIGRSSDGDRSQPWEAGQQGDARIGNPRALSELDLFERRHASKDLQAAVGDPGLAGVIGLQPGQAGDTLGRRVSRVAAVHEQGSSNRSQRPTWRKPSSSTSIGINARKAGKLGKADNEVSSTFLQLTANPRSACIAASAVNPRPPRFGHSQPQMYCMPAANERDKRNRLLSATWRTSTPAPQ